MQFPNQYCDRATGRNTGELGLGSMQGRKFLFSTEYRINWVSAKHLEIYDGDCVGIKQLACNAKPSSSSKETVELCLQNKTNVHSVF